MEKSNHYLPPNLSNFLDSFREIGYVCEVAIADIIDNCISAEANEIKIDAIENPEIKISILDNGIGMTLDELKEAMRLSSKSPKEIRDKNDLGRFGLGLKVASFSQCKKLTVFSKTKNGMINGLQWDLGYIAEKNDWYALIPNKNSYSETKELDILKSGTVVIWESVDKFENHIFLEELEKIRYHVGLVFHKFIDGLKGIKKIKFELNGLNIKSLNPFFNNNSGQELQTFDFTYPNGKIKVCPYVLPHHSNVTEIEYKKYGLIEGYIKSQGFYLYRNFRLVTWGTWWGLSTSTEALKLVRIEIEIPNTMDNEWNIDLKKSTAKPPFVFRQELKRVLEFVNPVGKRVYTGRITRKNYNNVIHLWNYIPRRDNNKNILKINRQHPLVEIIESESSIETITKINMLLDGLEQYLPIETLISQIISDPRDIDQSFEEDNRQLLENLIQHSQLSEEFKTELLKTEYFKK